MTNSTCRRRNPLCANGETRCFAGDMTIDRCSMRRPAIYLRVSSTGQDTASQKPDLERWAAAFAPDGAVWYEDKASGTNMDRPAWKRLEADVRAGKVSSVVVWRLDRLGRTAAGLTSLFEDLQRRKVNLVSIRDGVDLETPAGRLMANVLASVAQYETEVRSERQAAGIAKAKAQGKAWGGSTKGRLSKKAKEKAQAVRSLHEAGRPVAEIARAVGLSRPTVYRVLEAAS